MLYGRQIAWHFSSVCHGINQPTYPNGDSMENNGNIMEYKKIQWHKYG